jgi:hypothetical protein
MVYQINNQWPHTLYCPGLQPLYGNIYFHGTSKISAKEIWESGLWLSNRPYPMIWMTSDLVIAEDDILISGLVEDGRILVIELDESVNQELQQTALPECYYLRLDDSPNTGSYYQVEGLEVIQMLDFQGNLLKSK